jgi:predicted CXXCH cytochrome family protein
MLASETTRAPKVVALLVLAAIAGLTCILVRRSATKPPSSEYIGSRACLSCHAETNPHIAQEWQASVHHRTMKIRPAGEETAEASAPPGTTDAFAMIGRNDGPRALVDRDLRIRLSEGWEEVDVFGPPHEVVADQTGPMDIDAAGLCLGCHSTGYSVSAGAVAEPGVGCEACHGPGRRHVESDGEKGAIINPAALGKDRANMICGQCHSLGTDKSGKYPFPVRPHGRVLGPYRPGEELSEFFDDARPKRNGAGWEYSLLAGASDEYAEQLCTDCHHPHGKAGSPAMLKDPTSETCLKCHGVGNQRLRYENHWGLCNAIEKPCWHCHKNTHAH